MLSTSNPKKYFRGSGSLMFALELADGTISAAMWALGNAPGFERTITQTKETIRDFTVASQPISSEPQQDYTEEFTFKGKELSLEHMRILSMGEAGTPITQLVGSAQTATLEDVELDRYYNLGKRSISAVTAVVGAVSLTADDFEVVDAARGIVKILAGATHVEAGDDVVFTFDCAAIVAPGLPVIDGGKAETIRGRLFFFGDPQRGDTYDLTIWRCEATPDGATGFIGSTTGEFGIKFKAVLDPDHKDSPSQIVQLAASV